MLSLIYLVADYHLFNFGKYSTAKQRSQYFHKVLEPKETYVFLTEEFIGPLGENLFEKIAYFLQKLQIKLD